MLKKIKIILITLLCVMLCACDPGIYDFTGEDYNPFENLDFEVQDFLDPTKCYGDLLKDLEFMKSSCYDNEKLAASQAYTILMTYGLADKSKDPSTYTSAQLQTKADLFSTIKRINLYANNFTEGLINYYNAQSILSATNDAIAYCTMMLTFF